MQWETVNYATYISSTALWTRRLIWRSVVSCIFGDISCRFSGHFRYLFFVTFPKIKNQIYCIPVIKDLGATDLIPNNMSTSSLFKLNLFIQSCHATNVLHMYSNVLLQLCNYMKLFLSTMNFEIGQRYCTFGSRSPE